MNAPDVSDIISLQDLQRIAVLEERAAELEHKSQSLDQDAMDLRVQADEIVQSYREKLMAEGFAACGRRRRNRTGHVGTMRRCPER